MFGGVLFLIQIDTISDKLYYLKLFCNDIDGRDRLNI
jgi:hypothetical protein